MSARAERETLDASVELIGLAGTLVTLCESREVTLAGLRPCPTVDACDRHIARFRARLVELEEYTIAGASDALALLDLRGEMVHLFATLREEVPAF